MAENPDDPKTRFELGAHLLDVLRQHNGSFERTLLGLSFDTIESLPYASVSSLFRNTTPAEATELIRLVSPRQLYGAVVMLAHNEETATALRNTLETIIERRSGEEMQSGLQDALLLAIVSNNIEGVNVLCDFASGHRITLDFEQLRTDAATEREVTENIPETLASAISMRVAQAEVAQAREEAFRAATPAPWQTREDNLDAAFYYVREVLRIPEGTQREWEAMDVLGDPETLNLARLAYAHHQLEQSQIERSQETDVTGASPSSGIERPKPPRTPGSEGVEGP